MRAVTKVQLSAIGIGAIVCAALLVGCEHEAISTHQTNNSKVDVSVLFDYDGCRVYRFEDNGTDHYFAKCKDGNGVTFYAVPQGKSSRPEEIPTGRDGN